MCFSNIEHFPNGEINERSLSKSHPRPEKLSWLHMELETKHKNKSNQVLDGSVPYYVISKYDQKIGIALKQITSISRHLKLTCMTEHRMNETKPGYFSLAVTALKPP